MEDNALPSLASARAPRDPHRPPSVIGVFLGLCLMAGGQAILGNSDRVAAFLVRSPGAWAGVAVASFLADALGPGVVLGLGLLIMGALLVATAVGLPESVGETSREAADEATRRMSIRRAAARRVALAAVLAAAGVVALGRPDPGIPAVIFWLAALASAFLVAWALDRARHSPLGGPVERRWEWVLLLALMAASLAIVAHDLTNVRWAGTPDEAWFFAGAKALASGHLRPFLFSEDGVFGYHPVLSSVYQAAFMKVFGANVFGWRLSSALAMAVSVPLLYLFTRELWSRRAGVIAAVLFGTAQLAVGFAHFGYNNVQAYPVILASLAVLAVAIRRRSVAGHYLAGVIAGMGFYTFYTARLAPLLALLLLWSLGCLSLKRARAELGALVAGILLAVTPLLVHPAALAAHMLQQTAFAGAAGSGGAGSGGLPRVLSHWLLSVFYASWSRSGSNFGWRPPVDPIVGALSVAGLCLAVLALARGSRERFLAPAFLVCAFVTGAISQHPAPPLTRLLTLAPFTAILAAIALDRLMAYASRWARPRAAVVVAGTAVVAAAVVWNVAALHRSIYELHYGYGDGTTSELIRIARELPAAGRLIYVQNAENDMYDVDRVMDEYGLGKGMTYIRPFGPPALDALGEVSPPFAVVLDLKRDDEIRAVESTVELRFPGVRWHDSSPGKRWSLRVCSVPSGPAPSP